MASFWSKYDLEQYRLDDSNAGVKDVEEEIEGAKVVSVSTQAGKTSVIRD